MASSEADSLAGSTDTMNSSSAADAKAKREARKARILSSGTDRLARITKTGRGGEADTLYSDPPKSTAENASSSRAGFSDDSTLERDDELMFKRTQVAMQGGVLNANNEDDPGEIDISQQSNSMNSSNNNPFMMNQMGGQGGMPQDLAGMIQMMQSSMGGGAPPGFAGSAGQDGSAQQASPFPFAFPFAPPGSDPSSAQPTQSSATTLMDTVFNLLRIGVFIVFGVALVYGGLSGHAAAQQSVSENEAVVGEQFEHMTTLHRWARLAYERPAHWEARYFGVESFGLPIHGISVFWLFITLEVALQSSRIMLQRSRPSPPSFLIKASAYIPNAHIRLLIRTVASYLPLLDAFANDLAIVIFTIGCTIIFATWKVGLDPILSPSSSVLGANMGLQASDLGSGAASMGEKVLEMNNPVMANSPVHVAL